MGHTSISRGISGTDLVEYVTVLDTVVSRGCLARVTGRPSLHVMHPRLTYLEPQEDVPSGSNPLQRGYIYELVPKALLFRAMPTGPVVFLGMLAGSDLTPLLRCSRCIVFSIEGIDLPCSKHSSPEKITILFCLGNTHFFGL